MSKKIISLLLAVVLAFSMITVAFLSVSAAVDSEGRYVPSDEYKDNTQRLYFVMPEEWYNEEYSVTDAGAYWFGDPDACGSIDGTTWPGYKMQVADRELSLFYIDLPFTDPDALTAIVFNNFLDGGTRTVDENTGEVTYQYDEKRYKAATQTGVSVCTYYSCGDNDYYDSLLNGTFWDEVQAAIDNGDDAFFGNHKDNFFIHPDWGLSMNLDNMVYVIDPAKTSVNYVDKKIYLGEWYFYYGDGLYGALPNKEMAEKENLIFDLKNPATPDQPDPTEPAPTPSNPVTDKNEIYFDVGSSGWKNVNSVYCHIWRPDGSPTSSGAYWPDWQSSSEKCTYDKSTGIATFDLSKTGHNFSKSDGKIYCVAFSANTGMETYDTIMSGSCIGDTLYITGNTFESPEDLDRAACEAAWKNNADCGAVRRITSTGKVVGTTHPNGETDTTMMANFLITYYDNPAKMDLVPNLMKELNLNAKEVMGAVNDKLEATGNKDADKISKTIANILFVNPPTTEPVKIDGDVDMDGKFNVIDALTVLKYCADYGTLTPQQLVIADYNKDNLVNVIDVTVMQRKLANID